MLELAGVKIDRGLDQKKIAMAEKKAGVLLRDMADMEESRASLKEEIKVIAKKIPFSQLHRG